jgi:hypothetical protein
MVEAPMSEPTRTILQLSDLHIGRVNHQGIRWSNPIAWIPVSKFFPGILGHDQRARRAVADLWQSIFETGNADLVITGDLTAFGSSDQLVNARHFVENGLAVKRQVIGLHRGTSRQGIIPGNHDYFAGYPIPWGSVTPQMSNFF